MGSTFKARPTEYRGIVYKSKCEAMFARYLELSSEEEQDISKFLLKDRGGVNCFGPSHGWGAIYEPANFVVDDWRPDFLVWRCTSDFPDGDCLQLTQINYEVIEYKPSKPTETYVKEFGTRTGVLADTIKSLADQTLIYKFSFKLYYGSVFNNQRGFYVVTHFRDCPVLDRTKHWDIDWLTDWGDDVRATRFDLENPN